MVHHQFQVPDLVLADEQETFLETELSTQAHAALEPDLDLVSKGQVDFAGQFLRRQMAAGEPADITLLAVGRLEVELPLGAHRLTPPGGRAAVQRINCFSR